MLCKHVGQDGLRESLTPVRAVTEPVFDCLERQFTIWQEANANSASVLMSISINRGHGRDNNRDILVLFSVLVSCLLMCSDEHDREHWLFHQKISILMLHWHQPMSGTK